MSERFGFKRNGGWQEENSARLYKTSKPLNAFFRKKLRLCRGRYSILSEVHMITHGNEIKIFAGNSNRPLAEAIAKRLNTELGGAEVGCFSDGEDVYKRQVRENAAKYDAIIFSGGDGSFNEAVQGLCEARCV